MIECAKIIRTTVLVLQETNTLSFAAAVDPMRAANRQSGKVLFDWQFATPGTDDVALTSGLRIPAAPLHLVDHCDLLLVLAGFNVDAQATPPLCASLRRIAAGSQNVAGIDGGPWLMARAGLLDGHRATTHWEDLENFAAQFPAIAVANARFVQSDTNLTSGGAAPALDMMLHLIAVRFGRALSERVAGSFIYDSTAGATRPQHRKTPRADHSALTARAHEMMEAALEEPIAIKIIARRLGVSLRALQLQFRARLDTTPQAHYVSLRLDEADRLVTQTTLPLHDVALAAGFTSQSSFARAYGRRFAISARRRRQKHVT